MVISGRRASVAIATIVTTTLATVALIGAAGVVATADSNPSTCPPLAHVIVRCARGRTSRTTPPRWRSGDPDRDFSMSRCATCATVFVDPVPSADVLDAAYPDDFYGRRRSDTERIEEWFLSRRLRLCGPIAGRSVLDVGSGDGKFLRRAVAAGARAGRPASSRRRTAASSPPAHRSRASPTSPISIPTIATTW